MQVISPWDDWNLDQTFFTEFEEWQREHPTKRLDQILDNIQSTLERSDVKDLVELLPGGPIPVPLKGLVLALANLVKLGIKISAMKRRTTSFTKAILEWLSRVSDAFRRGTESGKFTVQTWENLADARNLVVEICRWAQSRLADKFWARITHGINIERDMEEFKTRLEETRLLFKDLSLIGLAQGQDATLTLMGTVSNRQDEILDQLATLAGRVRETLACEQLDTVSQLLGKYAAAKPTYTEQGRGTCDAGTRVSILHQIKCWVEDKERERPHDHEEREQLEKCKEWIDFSAPGVLWLFGDPGIGKSAIAATLCREYTNKGILGAQFFASINFPDTKDPLSIFPTLARQLAYFSPGFASHIYRLALHLAGDMFDTNLQSRLQHLFIDPLVAAFSELHGPPILVIIDGLDECRFDKQPDLAKALASLISASLPTRLRILLLSRRTPFFNKHLSDASRISLTSFNRALHGDVALYLRSHIQDIVEEYKDEATDEAKWRRWSQEIEYLVGQVANHAAGLYIWAVTAVRFIKQEVNIPGRGAARLPDLLQSLCQSRLGDIDALYTHILSRIYYHGKDDIDQYYLHRQEIRVEDLHKEGLAIFRDTMGFIIAMQPEIWGMERYMTEYWGDSSLDYFFLPKLEALMKNWHPDDRLDLGNFLDKLSTLLNWDRSVSGYLQFGSIFRNSHTGQYPAASSQSEGAEFRTKPLQITSIAYPEMHRSVIDFLLSPSPFSIDLFGACQTLSHLWLRLFENTGELPALSLSITLGIKSRNLQLRYKGDGQRSEGLKEPEGVIETYHLGFRVLPTAEYRWCCVDDSPHAALDIQLTNKDRIEILHRHDHEALRALRWELEDCRGSPYLLPDYISRINCLHHFVCLHDPIFLHSTFNTWTELVVEFRETNAPDAYIILDVDKTVEVRSNTAYKLHISVTNVFPKDLQFCTYIFFHRDGGKMTWWRHSGKVNDGVETTLESSRKPICFEVGWKGTMKVLQIERKLDEYQLSKVFPSEQLDATDYNDLDIGSRGHGFNPFSRLSYAIYRLHAVPYP